jgi:hypothetical protein
MEPHERKLALEAISATLAVFHGDDPLFSPTEFAALSDKDAKYGLMDLREAVRGMNADEIRHLSSELDVRGLSLTKLVLETVSIISSVARKKVWSEADLILLSAAREVLLSDQKERLRLELPD